MFNRLQENSQKNSIPENSTVSIHIYRLDEKNLWIENTTKLSRGQVSICFNYLSSPLSIHIYINIDEIMLTQTQVRLRKL